MYGLARFGARYIPRLYRGLRRLARPRVLRRRPRVMRRKKTQNKIHSFVRWCDKDAVYTTAELGPNSIVSKAVVQNLTYQFKLDDVVNPTDFTNLYDSYKINKIQLFLEPTMNQTSSPATWPVQRKIAVVHDYTDAMPLTQEDDYLEYANCKRYNIVRNNAIKLTLYPKIKNIIENKDGGANAYTTLSSNKVWLDMDNDEVPHFGLKIFIPASVSVNDDQLFRVRAKYWLSCKNSK